MLHVTSDSRDRNNCNDNNEAKRRLACLPRKAKTRGFRILQDWSGAWSLIDTKVEPQRALSGLLHVPLPEIELALLAPLPPPKIRTRKARSIVEAVRPDADQGAADSAPDALDEEAGRRTVSDLLTRLRQSS